MGLARTMSLPSKNFKLVEYQFGFAAGRLPKLEDSLSEKESDRAESGASTGGRSGCPR